MATTTTTTAFLIEAADALRTSTAERYDINLTTQQLLTSDKLETQCSEFIGTVKHWFEVRSVRCQELMDNNNNSILFREQMTTRRKQPSDLINDLVSEYNEFVVGALLCGSGTLQLMLYEETLCPLLAIKDNYYNCLQSRVRQNPSLEGHPLFQLPMRSKTIRSPSLNKWLRFIEDGLELMYWQSIVSKTQSNRVLLQKCARVIRELITRVKKWGVEDQMLSENDDYALAEMDKRCRMFCFLMVSRIDMKVLPSLLNKLNDNDDDDTMSDGMDTQQGALFAFLTDPTAKFIYQHLVDLKLSSYVISLVDLKQGNNFFMRDTQAWHCYKFWSHLVIMYYLDHCKELEEFSDYFCYHLQIEDIVRLVTFLKSQNSVAIPEQSDFSIELAKVLVQQLDAASLGHLSYELICFRGYSSFDCNLRALGRLFPQSRFGFDGDLTIAIGQRAGRTKVALDNLQQKIAASTTEIEDSRDDEVSIVDDFILVENEAGDDSNEQMSDGSKLEYGSAAFVPYGPNLCNTSVENEARGDSDETVSGGAKSENDSATFAPDESYLYKSPEENEDGHDSDELMSDGAKSENGSTAFAEMSEVITTELNISEAKKSISVKEKQLSELTQQLNEIRERKNEIEEANQLLPVKVFNCERSLESTKLSIASTVEEVKNLNYVIEDASSFEKLLCLRVECKEIQRDEEKVTSLNIEIDGVLRENFIEKSLNHVKAARKEFGDKCSILEGAVESSKKRILDLERSSAIINNDNKDTLNQQKVEEEELSILQENLNCELRRKSKILDDSVGTKEQESIRMKTKRCELDDAIALHQSYGDKIASKKTEIESLTRASKSRKVDEAEKYAELETRVKRLRKDVERMHQVKADHAKKLQSLLVVDLRKLCREKGLDSKGKKAELVERLEKNSINEDGSKESATIAERADASSISTNSTFSDGASETKKEHLIRSMKVAELKILCQNKGIETKGLKKAELIHSLENLHTSKLVDDDVDEEESSSVKEKDYSKMLVKQLRTLCSERDLSYTGLRKPELVNLLKNSDKDRGA